MCAADLHGEVHPGTGGELNRQQQHVAAPIHDFDQAERGYRSMRIKESAQPAGGLERRGCRLRPAKMHERIRPRKDSRMEPLGARGDVRTRKGEGTRHDHHRD